VCTHVWHSFFVDGNILSVCLKLFFVIKSVNIAKVGVGSFKILAEPFLAVLG